jgi:general secretion pathway protein G
MSSGLRIPRPGNRADQRGFTLIEIMLVVVIIGTLAAIVVPRLAGSSQKAKVNASRADISAFSTALGAFEIDSGRFPSAEEGLEALMEKPASIGDEDQWDGPYLPELKDDPWGNEYQYRYPGDFAVDFDLWSFGPDGQNQTEDDIRNVSTREDR